MRKLEGEHGNARSGRTGLQKKGTVFGTDFLVKKQMRSEETKEIQVDGFTTWQHLGESVQGEDRVRDGLPQIRLVCFKPSAYEGSSYGSPASHPPSAPVQAIIQVAHAGQMHTGKRPSRAHTERPFPCSSSHWRSCSPFPGRNERRATPHPRTAMTQACAHKPTSRRWGHANPRAACPDRARVYAHPSEGRPAWSTIGTFPVVGRGTSRRAALMPDIGGLNHPPAQVQVIVKNGFLFELHGIQDTSSLLMGVFESIKITIHRLRRPSLLNTRRPRPSSFDGLDGVGDSVWHCLSRTSISSGPSKMCLFAAPKQMTCVKLDMKHNGVVAETRATRLDDESEQPKARTVTRCPPREIIDLAYSQCQGPMKETRLLPVYPGLVKMPQLPCTDAALTRQHRGGDAPLLRHKRSKVQLIRSFKAFKKHVHFDYFVTANRITGQGPTAVQIQMLQFI
ncbi:hypothetical protein DFH07DRAFT_776818 [Mycena maculata]|uniref:Uncharacterized protein n=1 Tax=Mycena maculata TaxID=230809 RepID=A0AAD7IMJ8_9AGAR|nr:hypothetical protein DFH07DRAFT_776818 [Mycena maculata]